MCHDPRRKSSDGGTDFGQKSGVFWPDLGMASGTPAAQRCCAVSQGPGLTNDTLSGLQTCSAATALVGEFVDARDRGGIGANERTVLDRFAIVKTETETAADWMLPILEATRDPHANSNPDSNKSWAMLPEGFLGRAAVDRRFRTMLRGVNEMPE